MGGVNLPGFRIGDLKFSILLQQTHPLPWMVGSKGNLIPVGMINNGIVFPYLIGYNRFRNGSFKSGYRD